MRWFDRHLNLTWIIGVTVVPFISFIVFMVIAQLTFPLLEIFPLIIIPVILIELAISAWVLYKKGRSPFWALLMGIGSPLWLDDKKYQPEWIRYLTPKTKNTKQ